MRSSEFFQSIYSADTGVLNSYIVGNCSEQPERALGSRDYCKSKSRYVGGYYGKLHNKTSSCGDTDAASHHVHHVPSYECRARQSFPYRKIDS